VFPSFPHFSITYHIDTSRWSPWFGTVESKRSREFLVRIVPVSIDLIHQRASECTGSPYAVAQTNTESEWHGRCSLVLVCKSAG
jgi:hypothetical protein